MSGCPRMSKYSNEHSNAIGSCRTGADVAGQRMNGEGSLYQWPPGGGRCCHPRVTYGGPVHSGPLVHRESAPARRACGPRGPGTAAQRKGALAAGERAKVISTGTMDQRSIPDWSHRSISRGISTCEGISGRAPIRRLTRPARTFGLPDGPINQGVSAQIPFCAITQLGGRFGTN